MMAKGISQKQQFEKLRKNINERFNEIVNNAKEVTDNIGNALLDLAVHNCRARLDRATPKNAESEELIETVKNNIVKHESKDGEKSVFSMKVNADPENLYLFLEYGTGLVGEDDAHDEADDVGWSYGIRRQNYVDRVGKSGWFFPKTGTYIDENDEHPVILRQKYVSTREWVSESTRTSKNGKKFFVRKYTRKRPHGPIKSTYNYTYNNWVFSEGLKPVRYFYDTKVQIETMFDEIFSKSAQGKRIKGNVFVKNFGHKDPSGKIVGREIVSLKSWENAVISAINKKKM